MTFMKKRIPIFKFHIPANELGKYFDPICVLCKRKRSAINKFANLKGIKVLAGMCVFVIGGKARPICDSCLSRKKGIEY